MPRFTRSPDRPSRRWAARPCLERLEDRTAPAVTGFLSGGTLTVNGNVNTVNHIFLTLDAAHNQILLSDGGAAPIARFNNAAVSNIVVNANGVSNVVEIAQAITQPATLNGGPGNNILQAGGGPTTITGGTGVNRFTGGNGATVINATLGDNTVQGGNGTSTVTLAPQPPTVKTGALPGLTPQPGNPLVNRQGRDLVLGFMDRQTVTGLDPVRDRNLQAATTPVAPAIDPNSLTLGIPPSPNVTITPSEVSTLLSRAAAATSFDSAIVAVVDRNGRVLGVRVEGGVSPLITGNTEKLVFAIDGALAEARTAAFFANDTAPLTSRTIQFISQTTNTQREIESDPSISDPNSTLKGPGKVAPIEIGGNFPPGVPFTPLVDLFDIEETNRDTTLHPLYGVGGTTVGYAPLPQRFNINPAFIPANQTLLPNLANTTNNQILNPPNSYGAVTGIEPTAQPRGIGTLPGGIPIFKNGVLVGGIGVFFPGTTGFADAENSSLSANFNPNKPDLSMVAEYAAFAAVGGSINFPIGSLGGVAPLPGVQFPTAVNNQQIFLAGIALPLVGPPGQNGQATVIQFGQTLGTGNPNSGTNRPVDPQGDTLLPGLPAPEGFLVTPHAGTTLSAAQVQQVIVQGVEQALQTRAQIRLGAPFDNTTRMVLAVADPNTGEILGLFRMPDSTIFSIDVAVAKSRNNAYYADPNQLQLADRTPGVQPGVAFSSRTFRFLASPFFPEGINGSPPGPFSILNVPGSDPNTGLNTGPPLPASSFFANVVGHNDFFPQTNFHDPFNPLNQNGVVFFPGGVPLYAGGKLSGGVGVSGDGVDEDDVVTFSAAVGFTPPPGVLRADQTFVSGIRLPYQEFDRNPTNLGN